LIVGEEAQSAVQQADLQLNPDGLLEYREEDELAFQIASLSEPGNFNEIEDLNFSTLGFNCFIDLDSCANPRLAYEAMLKKINELVGIMDLKVYKPDLELLTISDVTGIREKLV
jgi:FtsZ-interacting cell division protein ZipA